MALATDRPFVITEKELLSSGSCGDHLASPAWDKDKRELVWPDWKTARARFTAQGDNGLRQLLFLRKHNLVPQEDP